MSIDRRVCILVAALLAGSVAAAAQQASPAQASPAQASPAQQASPAGMPPSRSIRLDVVVAAKSGPPVAGLEQRDFTVLDNNSPQPITSFKAVSKGQEPVEVILLIDAVNSQFDTVAYERGKVQNFLQANGGQLAFPTKIAVLTDKGVQIQETFSTNGNELNDVLSRYTIGLREITRAQGFWGASDRLKISLGGIHQLADYAAPLPGRKIVLWISPGWPLISGVNVYLNAQDQRQIYEDVVSLSTALRLARVTLYNINPLGVQESVAASNYYENFLKGVSKPSQTEIGDLGLQVLSVQSGGLALESSSDVTAVLKRCLEDLASWYEITFDAPVTEQRNEYHHIQVKLAKPGLTARTRDGYYAQP
jgi:VWFA-related protein